MTTNLHNLTKTTMKNARRLGRGHGSGRSKTSGRGTKGQKARRDIPLHFEGGALPLIKRLPFLKGKGRNKTVKINTVIINIDKLNIMPASTIVNFDSLIKYKLVKKEEVENLGMKILAGGDLKVSLTVNVPVSKTAKEKIEKAGGSVSV